MVELLNVYRVQFKQLEPIEVAASSVQESMERISKLELSDEVVSVCYVNKIYV